MYLIAKALAHPHTVLTLASTTCSAYTYSPDPNGTLSNACHKFMGKGGFNLWGAQSLAANAGPLGPRTLHTGHYSQEYGAFHAGHYSQEHGASHAGHCSHEYGASHTGHYSHEYGASHTGHYSHEYGASHTGHYSHEYGASHTGHYSHEYGASHTHRPLLARVRCLAHRPLLARVRRLTHTLRGAPCTLASAARALTAPPLPINLWSLVWL